MNTLHYATIQQLTAALANKTISYQDIKHHYTERIKTVDPLINALLEHVDTSSTHQQNSNGPLYGIPGVIKNNICVQGIKTTCASKILAPHVPTYTATAVERLHATGAYILGTGNMDEFAMGSSTEHSAFKKTKNPWNLDCVPGGSSGGPAAAVAAGLVPWALGSDTGGSIRQPAGFCGVVGMRPTYGKVSRYGLIAYGSSLDQIGPFTRTVADNAHILSAIAGQDPRDGTTRPGTAFNYTAFLKEKLPQGIRVGVVENALHQEGIDPEVRKNLENAITTLQALGATIIPVKVPSFDLSTAAYFIISRAEAASNLARFDGVHCGMRAAGQKQVQQLMMETRLEGFGKEVRSRIIVGNYVLSAGHADAYYQRACNVRALIQHELKTLFNGTVDVLFMPLSPTPAFQLGAYDIDPLQMDLQDYFTCPVNLAGIPALAVPCGFTHSGLPVGMQLLASYDQESLLYQVGYAYEQHTQWYQQHPQL